MSPRCPIFSTSWVSITCTALPPHHVGQPPPPPRAPAPSAPRPLFPTSWVSIPSTALPPYHVGQQRHLAGALDGRGRLALVLRAEAGDPGGPGLATVGDEPVERCV